MWNRPWPTYWKCNLRKTTPALHLSLTWTMRAYFLFGQRGHIFYLDREGLFFIWTGRAYFQQETLIGQPCHIDPDQSSEMVNTLGSDLDRFWPWLMIFMNRKKYKTVAKISIEYHKTKITIFCRWPILTASSTLRRDSFLGILLLLSCNGIPRYNSRDFL